MMVRIVAGDFTPLIEAPSVHPRSFAAFRCLSLLIWLATASAADLWVDYAGQDGPGKGKHSC